MSIWGGHVLCVVPIAVALTGCFGRDAEPAETPQRSAETGPRSVPLQLGSPRAQEPARDWPGFEPLGGFRPLDVILYGDGARHLGFEDGGVIVETLLCDPAHDVSSLAYTDRASMITTETYAVVRDGLLVRWEMVDPFRDTAPSLELVRVTPPGLQAIKVAASAPESNLSGVFVDRSTGDRVLIFADVPDVLFDRDDGRPPVVTQRIVLPTEAGPIAGLAGSLTTFESGRLLRHHGYDEGHAWHQVPFDPGERALLGGWYRHEFVVFSRSDHDLVRWSAPTTLEADSRALDWTRQVLGPAGDITRLGSYGFAMAGIGETDLVLVCLGADSLTCPVPDVVRKIAWRDLLDDASRWALLDMKVGYIANTGRSGPRFVYGVHVLLDSEDGQALLTIPFTTPWQADLVVLGDVGARGLETAHAFM